IPAEWATDGYGLGPGDSVAHSAGIPALACSPALPPSIRCAAAQLSGMDTLMPCRACRGFPAEPDEIDKLVHRGRCVHGMTRRACQRLRGYLRRRTGTR